MNRVRLVDKEKEHYCIICKGCDHEHVIAVGVPFGHSRGSEVKWEFNYNLEKPTFSPSLLVKSGKYVMTPEEYNKLTEDERNFVDENSYICHSFIHDGQIQYLSDCTHHLAGQTIDLPEYEERPNTTDTP